jgi:hypothetical protein
MAKIAATARGSAEDRATPEHRFNPLAGPNAPSLWAKRDIFSLRGRVKTLEDEVASLKRNGRLLGVEEGS